MSRCMIPILAASLILASGARAQVWPDSFFSRLEALALLQTLDSDLLSHDSATLTLDRWCGDHHLAEPAKIVARRRTDVDKPASADQRRLLGVGADEPIRYRRVQLLCGDHVLSEADNWYVPSRLAPAMNHALDTSDVAFGRAVQALRFQRHTLSAETLWRPLPEGWESRPADRYAPDRELAIPDHVLQHRALLELPDGRPISEVVETYTSEVFAFRPPAAPAGSR